MNDTANGGRERVERRMNQRLLALGRGGSVVGHDLLGLALPIHALVEWGEQSEDEGIKRRSKWASEACGQMATVAHALQLLSSRGGGGDEDAPLAEVWRLAMACNKVCAGRFCRISSELVCDEDDSQCLAPKTELGHLIVDATLWGITVCRGGGHVKLSGQAGRDMSRFELQVKAEPKAGNRLQACTELQQLQADLSDAAQAIGGSVSFDADEDVCRAELFVPLKMAVGEQARGNGQ